MLRVCRGLLVVGVTAMSLTACSSSPSSPSAGSNLTIMLKDSPFSDAKALLVTFSEVSAHVSGTGGFTPIPFSGGATSRTCDLKKLAAATDVLGTGTLDAGHYTQVRLSCRARRSTSTTRRVARPAGVDYPRRRNTGHHVRRGTQSESRIRRDGDGATTITLDFDGDQSVHAQGNGQYNMSPVIAVVGCSELLGSRLSGSSFEGSRFEVRGSGNLEPGTGTPNPESERGTTNLKRGTISAPCSSPDARVAFRPEATYHALVTEAAPAPWLALRRPALVLLVIAVSVSIASVHQITLSLLLTTAAAWGAILVIQIAIGAVVIASARSRRVGFAHALDLWFAGHLPYSLWILMLPILTVVPVATPHEVMGLSVVVPLVWTTSIVSAFCRVVLGLSPAAARRRVALHLVLVVCVGGAVVVWAAGGPAALLSYGLRRLSGTWM